MAQARDAGPKRAHLTCGNQAHAYAAMPVADKDALVLGGAGNLGIVTAYNDMLSAHQPFETYPALIRRAAREAGGTAQVAGGVPAMCDGVTQGQAGMELSLFSRDVIAMAAGIALSHDVFDSTVYLGVCDKIVPGLVIAAATFGHLPAVFIPAGPMISGIPNDEKAKVRQQFATGEVGREALMAAEMASYHGPGTCTFYGDEAERLFGVVAELGVPASAAQAELELARLHLAKNRQPLAIDLLEHLLVTYPASAVVPQARRLLDVAKGAVPPFGEERHRLESR
jgi:phosphogluconate dehydratase